MPVDELGMGVGTWPCIFKLGNSFYDYTKFKLANDAWLAHNLTSTESEIINFGWCQTL